MKAKRTALLWVGLALGWALLWGAPDRNLAGAGEAPSLRLAPLRSPSTSALGPVDFSALPWETSPGRADSRASKGSAVLPPALDLRKEGRVIPSVGLQTPSGLCWAFAALGSAESGLLPSVDRDFSEWHLAFAAFHGTSCGETFDLPEQETSPRAFADHGADTLVAAAVLARGDGPAEEVDCPFGTDVSGKTPEDFLVSSDRTILGEAVWLHVLSTRPVPESLDVPPADPGRRGREILKGILRDQGPLVVCYDDDLQKYYNPKTFAYYCDDPKASESVNHYVMLVGWDDRFPRSRFRTPPPVDGAWLAKNSYSSSWGDGGYFWISYADRGMVEGCFLSLVPHEYRRVYQYDPLGMTRNASPGGNEVWLANVFEAPEDDVLTGASFYTTDLGTSYEVYVIPDFQGFAAAPPAEGNLLARGERPYPGYVLVSLDREVSVRRGSRFAVVVHLKNPSYPYPAALEAPVADWYRSKASARPGQSYWSSDGVHFADLTEQAFEGAQSSNVCVKAFARGEVPASSDLSVSRFSVVPPPTAEVPSIFSARASGGTPPYRYRFSFGDRGQEDGGSSGEARHAYLFAKSYVARVTVEDAAGRRATRTLPVAVRRFRSPERTEEGPDGIAALPQVFRRWSDASRAEGLLEAAEEGVAGNLQVRLEAGCRVFDEAEVSLDLRPEDFGEEDPRHEWITYYGGISGDHFRPAARLTVRWDPLSPLSGEVFLKQVSLILRREDLWGDSSHRNVEELESRFVLFGHPRKDKGDFLCHDYDLERFAQADREGTVRLCLPELAVILPSDPRAADPPYGVLVSERDDGYQVTLSVWEKVEGTEGSGSSSGGCDGGLGAAAALLLPVAGLLRRRR